MSTVKRAGLSHKRVLSEIKVDQNSNFSSNKRAKRSSPSKVKLTDFELLAKIGRGGFGEVFVCRKRDTGEILALKVMEKSLIWKKNKVRQVKNERDVLAKGTTNYMVRLMYSFQDKKYLYLAMEYCPGGDLRHLLENIGVLSCAEARIYMAEMIMAVYQLHQLGYIHRDLKPDNFLIGSDGHIKLTDFGLSKEGIWSAIQGRSLSFSLSPVIDSAHFGANKAFSVVGSPLYMAPEVVAQRRSNGHGIGYSVEVDWWSLGCIFFEMVVGYSPFAAASPEEVFANVENWKFVLPEVFDEACSIMSAELLDFLQKLLCEPSERYGDSDMDSIQSHPLFEGINWRSLRRQETPFVPKLDNDEDTTYFDTESKSPPRFPDFGKMGGFELRRVESSPAVPQFSLSRTTNIIPTMPKIKVKEMDDVEKENWYPNSQRARAPSTCQPKVPMTAPKPQAAISRLPVAIQSAKKKRNSDKSLKSSRSSNSSFAATPNQTNSKYPASRFATPMFKTPTKTADQTPGGSPDREILGFTFKRPRTTSLKMKPERPKSLISQKLNFDEMEDDFDFEL